MNRPKVEAPTTTTAAQQAAPTAQQAVRPATAPTATGTPIKAPLPGTITDIKVTVGQQVSVGDTVVVLEAMKMQNNIESEYAGKVVSVLVNKGDTVMEGSVLITLG
jgi:biotin carboxyl carrier protein